MGCSCSVSEAPPKLEEWPEDSNPGILHIFSIDDEPVNTRILDNKVRLAVEALQKEGRAPETVVRGTGLSNAEARSLLDSVPPTERAIVLLDQVMPKENGDILVRERRSPNIVFVAATANAEDRHMRKYFEAGYNGVMQKPFETETVKQVIRRFWVKPGRWWTTVHGLRVPE